MVRYTTVGCLIADLQRVYAQTGRLTAQAYRSNGYHSLGTVYKFFPRWQDFVRASQIAAPAPARARGAWSRRAARKLRACLRCGVRFPSFGPGNRLCSACRRAIALDPPGLDEGLIW